MAGQVPSPTTWMPRSPGRAGCFISSTSSPRGMLPGLPLHVGLVEQRKSSMGCKRAPGHTATIIDEVKTWRCQAPPRHVSADPPFGAWSSGNTGKASKKQPAKAEPEPRGGTWLAACPRGKVDLCRVPGPHSFDRCASSASGPSLLL